MTVPGPENHRRRSGHRRASTAHGSLAKVLGLVAKGRVVPEKWVFG